MDIRHTPTLESIAQEISRRAEKDGKPPSTHTVGKTAWKAIKREMKISTGTEWTLNYVMVGDTEVFCQDNKSKIGD